MIWTVTAEKLGEVSLKLHLVLNKLYRGGEIFISSEVNHYIQLKMHDFLD